MKGTTVDASTVSLQQSQGSYASLIKLIKEMNDGQVDALLIYKSNPVYSLPKSPGIQRSGKKSGPCSQFR